MNHKYFKVFTATAITACLMTSAAFAGTGTQSASTTLAAKTTTQAAAKVQGRGPAGRDMKAGNPMDSLIKAGTITQTQADAIRTAMDAARAAGTNKTMQTILDGLVKAGTITADQETAILKDMPQHDGNGPDGRGPKGGNHRNPMSNLVTAKTITQAQADAIRTAMDAARAAGTNKTMQTILDGLVKAGTITADQETAILKDMPQPPQAK